MLNKLKKFYFEMETISQRIHVTEFTKRLKFIKI